MSTYTTIAEDLADAVAHMHGIEADLTRIYEEAYAAEEPVDYEDVGYLEDQLAYASEEVEELLGDYQAVYMEAA